MRRGTTPLLKISVKDFDFTPCEVIIISIEGKSLVNINKDRISIEDGVLSARLTQEETLSLGDGNANVQIKCKMPDGIVVASNIVKTKVDKIINTDII